MTFTHLLGYVTVDVYAVYGNESNSHNTDHCVLAVWLSYLNPGVPKHSSKLMFCSFQDFVLVPEGVPSDNSDHSERGRAISNEDLRNYG